MEEFFSEIMRDIGDEEKLKIVEKHLRGSAHEWCQVFKRWAENY